VATRDRGSSAADAANGGAAAGRKGSLQNAGVALQNCVAHNKKCVAACATRCICSHMPKGPVRQPSARMKEEDARKWLVVKDRKDFARFRWVGGLRREKGGDVALGMTVSCPCRMICFHYAGGNSNMFKTWDFKDTEMVMVELPARNA
jgi:hypothetical protein